MTNPPPAKLMIKSTMLKKVNRILLMKKYPITLSQGVVRGVLGANRLPTFVITSVNPVQNPVPRIVVMNSTTAITKKIPLSLRNILNA